MGEKLMWKEGLRKENKGHFYPSDHLAVIHTYALPATVTNRTASIRD